MSDILGPNALTVGGGLPSPPQAGTEVQLKYFLKKPQMFYYSCIEQVCQIFVNAKICTLITQYKLQFSTSIKETQWKMIL